MNLILVIQIIISLLLVSVIVVQVKGTGFGRVWGGMGTSFARRGLERIVFKLTFVLSFLFMGISLLALLV